MLSANGRGVLVVRSWHDADREMVILDINDDGPGIPDDVQPKIFDPFFTTKEVGKGTGLGLTVAYAIVQEHGGRIRLESRPQRGASFYVELPVSGQACGDHRAARVSRPRAASWPARRCCSSKTNRRSPTPSWTRSSTKATSSTGRRTESRRSRGSSEKPYDLVICDLKMPKRDGMEFYRALAESVPALSKRVDLRDRRRRRHRMPSGFWRRAGCRWLAKPFRLGDLLRAVREELA